MPLQQVHVRQVIRNLMTSHKREEPSLPYPHESFLAKALVVEADEAFDYKKNVRKQS
jgi:hypothetical protein